MHFIKALSSVALVAIALVAAPVRALTAAQVTANINIITTQSRDLQAPANSINLVNGALAVIGQGPIPQVVAGFNSIINTVTTDIAAMQGTNPFTVPGDEADIVNALTTFVTVHQELLNILIGKSGIIQNVFFGPPIAAVLRQLESVVDQIAFAIIDMVPDRTTDATNQKNSLDVTLGQAITAYSGI